MEADIHRIASGVIACNLPKPEWTHQAHFALAIWLLRHRPATALDDVPGLIRAYNVSTGTANTDAAGYHHTITIASMRAAASMLAAAGAGAPLAGVLAAIMSSPFGRSDWLLAHWSRPVLFSAAARRGWVDPDLSPLVLQGEAAV
ncbi:hypothetical protein GC169_02860 [bacterium]|nr:hypothetical protein [bacterium]